MASQSFSERQINESDNISKTAPPDTKLLDDSITILTRQDSTTRRIRIIHLLRRTFGEELERLPQFAAIVNCLKNECTHTFTETSTQTNGELDNNRNVHNNNRPMMLTKEGTIDYYHNNNNSTSVSGSLRHRGIGLGVDSESGNKVIKTNYHQMFRQVNNGRSSGTFSLSLFLFFLCSSLLYR